jgi:hypothetical protein
MSFCLQSDCETAAGGLSLWVKSIVFRTSFVQAMADRIVGRFFKEQAP